MKRWLKQRRVYSSVVRGCILEFRDTVRIGRAGSSNNGSSRVIKNASTNPVRIVGAKLDESPIQSRSLMRSTWRVNKDIPRQLIGKSTSKVVNRDQRRRGVNLRVAASQSRNQSWLEFRKRRLSRSDTRNLSVRIERKVSRICFTPRTIFALLLLPLFLETVFRKGD